MNGARDKQTATATRLLRDYAHLARLWANAIGTDALAVDGELYMAACELQLRVDELQRTAERQLGILLAERAAAQRRDGGLA